MKSRIVVIAIALILGCVTPGLVAASVVFVTASVGVWTVALSCNGTICSERVSEGLAGLDVSLERNSSSSDTGTSLFKHHNDLQWRVRLYDCWPIVDDDLTGHLPGGARSAAVVC